MDNPSDFNQMVRLRAYLMGEVDSRAEVQSGLPTLEALQKRYQQMQEERAQAKDSATQAALPEHLYGFDGAARARGEGCPHGRSAQDTSDVQG